MKNKFVNGLLAGICATLLFCMIAVGVINKTNLVNANEPLSKGTHSSGQSDSGDKDEEAHQKKKAYVKGIISKYYLGDITEEEYRVAELRSLLDALDDPYSCYYTKEEYVSILESTNGIYSGIGSTVSQSAQTGVIKIVKPFTGGPAYEAGLLPDDIIYTIEGEEVTGKDLSQVVSIMKGERGTDVTIEVVREGVPDPIEFVITRDRIEVPTVEYEMLDDGIGYIYVLEFDQVTEEQFRNALDDLEKQGMKGLVIDVRNNPGGLLHIVVGMLERLLPEGIIVYTEDKNGEGDEYFSNDKEKIDIPVTVLINGNSASASEIFAGALQDYGVATIVGTTSFGKGIVQKLIPLSDGSAVKITESRYFTPNGKCIHGEGIIPDVEVELDEGLEKMVEIPKEDDNQLQKAIEILKKEIK